MMPALAGVSAVLLGGAAAALGWPVRPLPRKAFVGTSAAVALLGHCALAIFLAI